MYRSAFTSILLVCICSMGQAERSNYGYNFASNLPFAHIINSGPVADASQIGFAKYARDLSGKWKTGVTHKNRSAAYIPGLQSHLWLPTGGHLSNQDLAIEFMIDPLGSDQRLDIFVAGKKIGHKVLKPGWQTHTIKVPNNLVKKSDLHVRLHFRRTVAHRGRKTAAALRYMRLKSATSPELPVDESSLKNVLNIGDLTAIRVSRQTGLDWYLVPVKGNRFTANSTGSPVQIWAQTDGSKPKKLSQGTTLDVDLSRYANKAVRIMLRSAGDATIQGAQLTGGTPGAPSINKAPKHVVFWLIDTLRADKLSVYKQRNANRRPKPRTPHLEALAKEGTVFQNFWVQGNESKASHASLFTGTYPAVHRVINHKANLPGKLTTIAEAFTTQGYLSGGYVSNGYISQKWNFAQGFNKKVFVNNIRKSRANNARAILRQAKSFIDRYKTKPFYLYLGTSDPHVTYRRHKNLIKRYDNKPYSGLYQKSLTGTELGEIKSRKTPPSKRDQTRIEALYENEIEFNDIHFGKLVAHLKAAGIYDDTMIIVSSDHGDEFWEHGSCGHGQSLHQELISVPLIIKMPGWFPKGKRVYFGTDGVDLLPTIQRVLGQTPAGDIQGEDVLGKVWSKGPIYPIAQVASMGVKKYALQVGPAKVIMAGPSALSVYDTGNDPAEQKNVLKTKPILVRAAMDPLAIFAPRASKWKKKTWGAANNLDHQFTRDNAGQK